MQRMVFVRTGMFWSACNEAEHDVRKMLPNKVRQRSN